MSKDSDSYNTYLYLALFIPAALIFNWDDVKQLVECRFFETPENAEYCRFFLGSDDPFY